MTIENEDDAYDAMVERVDAGVECPHCRSGSEAITPTEDPTGKPLFVCGCGAQFGGFFEVKRPPVDFSAPSTCETRDWAALVALFHAIKGRAQGFRWKDSEFYGPESS